MKKEDEEEEEEGKTKSSQFEIERRFPAFCVS
jgi:hypothetical protein